jgi:hypothetical protein
VHRAQAATRSCPGAAATSHQPATVTEIPQARHGHLMVVCALVGLLETRPAKHIHPPLVHNSRVSIARSRHYLVIYGDSCKNITQTLIAMRLQLAPRAVYEREGPHVRQPRGRAARVVEEVSSIDNHCFLLLIDNSWARVSLDSCRLQSNQSEDIAWQDTRHRGSQRPSGMRSGITDDDLT